MSICTVQPVYDLGKRTDYLTLGVGTKKQQHQRAGTDRLAPGFYCDAATIDEFIGLGNAYAEQHGRRVKGQSYVLSFSPEELDVQNPDDLAHAGGLGFLLAKSMHPGSPCLVVVHDDSKGGAVHAHITVLNHDTVTGRALRDYRVHWRVKQANDRLMREHGMRVIEPAPKRASEPWQARRAGLGAFEQKLGDTIASVVHDPTVTSLSEFETACAARGVEVVTTEHTVKSDKRYGKQAGDTALGFTYRMRDDLTPGKKARVRRRKASALATEFTPDALAARFTERLAPKPPAPTPTPAPRLTPEPVRQPQPVDDEFEQIAMRLKRRMASKTPKTPARERFVRGRQRQPQRDREFGD